MTTLVLNVIIDILKYGKKSSFILTDDVMLFIYTDNKTKTKELVTTLRKINLTKNILHTLKI